MATTTDAMIFTALVAKLQALVPALPIAGPNVTFPAAGQPTPAKYLTIDFLPNRNRPFPIGDDAEPHQGLFQVSVKWPKGNGIADALDVAGAIIDHFKNQTLFVGGLQIKINREPWAASPMQDDDRLIIPVSISYIAFPPET